METALRQLVMARAKGRCEYCQFPEAFSYLPFQVDHIIAQKHRGPTIESNLAWTCYYCNSYKGPNICGWILESDTVVRLFHPRKDDWDEHFTWHGALLVAKSDVGQATIDVLEINHLAAVELREWLLELGLPEQ